MNNKPLRNGDLRSILFPPSVTVRYNSPKIGRNQPCPCGSGKKYKNCCNKLYLDNRSYKKEDDTL